MSESNNMLRVAATSAVAAGFSPTGNPLLSPSFLLDVLKDVLHLKSDAELARVLGEAPPNICNIRSGRRSIGHSMLINMHEVSDLSIKELRTLAGMTPYVLSWKKAALA